MRNNQAEKIYLITSSNEKINNVLFVNETYILNNVYASNLTPTYKIAFQNSVVSFSTKEGKNFVKGYVKDKERFGAKVERVDILELNNKLNLKFKTNFGFVRFNFGVKNNKITARMQVERINKHQNLNNSVFEITL